MPKKVYRVRNWPEYSKALKQRGSITLWINAETVKSWESKKEQYLGKGRPEIYSTLAIETCITLKVLLNLAFRQCEGLMGSLFSSWNLAVKVPSYTQLCRRQKGLDMKLKHSLKGPLPVVVDATGLKVFGEGEWKVRQHGYSQHRMWRKLHIGALLHK
jgi:Transposase DDE domain